MVGEWRETATIWICHAAKNTVQYKVPGLDRGVAYSSSLVECGTVIEWAVPDIKKECGALIFWVQITLPDSTIQGSCVAFLHSVVIKCSDISKEHNAPIYSVTESAPVTR
jgi:hypothetical protein